MTVATPDDRRALGAIMAWETGKDERWKPWNR